MTTHELARKLLDGPDVEVYVEVYGASCDYTPDGVIYDDVANTVTIWGMHL